MELRCHYVRTHKQIEIFVKGADKIPPLTVDPTLQPRAVIEQAYFYHAYCVAKLPGGTQIDLHEGGLKTSYYLARKVREADIKALYNPPCVQSHKCELRGGQYPEGELRLEGIPDVIGEMEAWKTWVWDDESNMLQSPSRHENLWRPLQVMTAQCHRCPNPPCTNCMCGIYAGTQAQAHQYGQILGMLKQWGRFVQGSQGVKSQYAYPSWFLLKEEQEPLIDYLQQYGVPIKMMVPTTMWDPTEVGFRSNNQGDKR